MGPAPGPGGLSVTVILPEPALSASGWSLVDYSTAQATTPPATGGAARLELEQLAGTDMWLIDHAVVACDGTNDTTVRWYASTENPGALLDGSDSGRFDVADWPNGLLLRPSAALVVVWSGASDGAVGTITLQYRLLRRF